MSEPFQEILVSPVIEDDRVYTSAPDITSDQIDRVVKMIRSGVTIRRALSAVAVNSAKYTRWKNRADKGIYPYADIFDKFNAAEDAFLATCEMLLSDQMADGDAMIALKVLERRDPGTYAPRTQTDINANFTMSNEDMLASLTAALMVAPEITQGTDVDDLLLDPVNDYVRPDLQYGDEGDDE